MEEKPLTSRACGASAVLPNSRQFTPAPTAGAGDARPSSRFVYGFRPLARLTSEDRDIAAHLGTVMLATFRRRHGASLIALSLGLALPPAAAQAQGAASQAVALDIPAQPMTSALAEFTAATGVQVVTPAGGIAGTSATVSGTLRPEAALGQLLAGSGYAFSFTGPRTAVLSAMAGAAPAPVADGSLLLGPILVTGAGGNSTPGASQVVIGQQDIERLAPRDIADLFRITPSVSVGSSIPMSQKLYVNGVEETNLAVSIDGARQNNRIFHHNATNAIDPALLGQVRVEAGVAPADAGPGAMGGAVTFETIDARDLLDGLDGRGARSYNTFDTNGSVATSALTAYAMHNGFEGLASINVGRGGSFDDGDGNRVEGTSTDFVSGLGKIAYETEAGHRFELSFEQVKDDADRPFRANIGSIGTDAGLRNYDLKRQNTVFTYSNEAPVGWLDPKVVVGYAKTELSVLDPWGSTGETDSWSGRAENLFTFDLGTVVAGIDAYRDTADYADPDYSARERAENVGFYAQARLEPFARTRFGFGARYDTHKLTGVGGQRYDNSGFSGNVGGEFDLTDSLTLRAAYSHVWSGPSTAENFIANPDWTYAGGLKPMEADNYTAGIVFNLGSFVFEGNYFDTNIDHVRTATWVNGSLTRDLKTHGFEVAGGYAWANGQARFGYTDTDVEIDGVVADSYYGNYLGVPAGQAFTVDVTHSFPAHGITIGGDAEFGLENDDTKATDGGRALPSYQVVNVFAEYQPLSLPTVTLRAEVRNLFDEQYSARSTYGQDFVDVTPLSEPGRSFIFGAVARF